MGIVIRQSILSTLVNYVGTFIGFLTTMFIVTAFLSEEDLGLTRVLLEAGLLFSGFAQLGVSSSALRFFPYFKDKKKQNNGFFFYLMAVPFVGMLLFIPLFLLLKEPISAYFEKNSPLFVDYYNWIIPLMFFLLYWTVFESYSSILMRITVPKFIREIGIRVVMVGVYLVYGLGFISLNAFIACFILVYGGAMVAMFFYVSRIGSVSLRHTSSFIDKPLRKHFLSYTAILLIGSLGGSIVSKIDIFMVTSGIGLASTGIYTIAFYMAAIIEIPSRSITQISAPLASDALMAGDFKKANNLYKKVSLHQFMIGSMIFLLIWINIDNIYAIIPNGDVYKTGKWVVFFIGISKLVEVTLSFGGNLISYSKYYHWGLYFVFFIAALSVFTNNLFIPLYGVTGAALATTISCGISYAVQQWLIFVKIKGNPFSIGTGKQLGVILLLFVLNRFLPNIPNPWIDTVYRTLLMLAVGVPAIYLLRISEEVNHLVGILLSRLRK